MDLFVLTPSDEPKPACVLVNNQPWVLSKRILKPDGSNEAFSCISYTWGLGTSPSPFHDGFNVSDHTIPALVATVRHRPECRAIWVDAFCVPYGHDDETQRQRALTLESMGFIYSRAEEVIVVLSPSSEPALERIQAHQPLLGEHLELLEREDWVTRAWTYQEAANSQRLTVISEDGPFSTGGGCGVASVGQQQIFSAIGEALGQGHAAPGEDQSLRATFPRLDAFEELLADCAVASYQERSAMQVMSIMSRRTQQREVDHFYAMIGAVTTELASSSSSSSGETPGSRSACDAFMELCERKGDFSFIYSNAPRDARPGLTWRPADHPKLPPILSWHSWGDRQPGRWLDGQFYLEDMIVFQEGPLHSQSRIWLEWYMGNVGAGVYASLDEGCLETLRETSLCGGSDVVSIARGFFFPCWEVPRTYGDVEILVSSRIRWRFGAPGLCRYWKTEFEVMVPQYCPGVFFGKLGNDESIQSVCLTK